MMMTILFINMSLVFSRDVSFGNFNHESTDF